MIQLCLGKHLKKDVTFFQLKLIAFQYVPFARELNMCRSFEVPTRVGLWSCNFMLINAQLIRKYKGKQKLSIVFVFSKYQ